MYKAVTAFFYTIKKSMIILSAHNTCGVGHKVYYNA